MRYPLVLSSKAELEWLGFSFEGSPVTVDSAGIVRLTKNRFQNQWVQIADTRKNIGKSDHYFIIAVSERDAHLRCIFCKACTYPPVLPKPLVQTIPVSLPVAEPETDKGQAEAAFWTSAALVEHDDTVISMQEQLLKLVALSCKSDRDFRACEVASLFPSAESLQLAIKYASRLKKMNLASKFGEIALRRRQEEEEEEMALARGRGREDEDDFDRPPDSQMSLFDDSPPPKPRSSSRARMNDDQEEEEEMEAEEEEEGADEESGPLLQLDKKSQKPLTPLVATASPSFNTKKSNGAGNPFKKQMSMDASAAAEAGGKNVFAALAKPPPTLLKKASSFTSSAGSRFSKAAGKKGAGDNVIKPPPVKRKPGAAGSQGGKKTTASLARSFETQTLAGSAAVASSASSSADSISESKTESIVTSPPASASETGSPLDESPFAFWRRCNLDSILADLDEAEAEDEDAVTQHCVKKFRELPTGERKEWISKFNTQKQASQKGNVTKEKNEGGGGGRAVISEQNGKVATPEEMGKKRKLETDEEEDKEQKPPTVKTKLAAFAFAGGD